MNKLGRRIEPRRRQYKSWLPPLSVRQLCRALPLGLLDQLDACKSDEARRLILGVSEQEAA